MSTTKKMTKAEMAVAVAKDVIRRLRYIKVGHAYIDFNIFNIWKMPEVHKAIRENRDMQSVVLDMEKNCRVCGLGACVLSKARLFNKVALGDLVDGIFYRVDQRTVKNALREVFSEHQCDLIEAAYEECDMRRNTSPSTGIERAIAFGKRFTENDKTRLRQIMKNIIKNNGIFVPPPIKKTEGE